MQIGELAKRGGVGVETVRFYERQGLLLAPERKPSGYRIYGDRDLKRLLFVRQAKVLGFSLQDIREIISARGRGQCPCGTVIGIAERHLRETEQQIHSLTAFHNELRWAVAQWKREGQQQVAADAICTLIERTIERRLNGPRRRPTKKNR